VHAVHAGLIVGASLAGVVWDASTRDASGCIAALAYMGPGTRRLFGLDVMASDVLTVLAGPRVTNVCHALDLVCVLGSLFAEQVLKTIPPKPSQHAAQLEG
jgi:hypothetical protein